MHEILFFHNWLVFLREKIKEMKLDAPFAPPELNDDFRLIQPLEFIGILSLRNGTVD